MMFVIDLLEDDRHESRLSAAMTRRQALCQAGTGLGMLGLVGLLGDAGLLGQAPRRGRRPAAPSRRTRWRPGPRTSRPGPSTSSTSTSTAGRRRSTRSIPSRCSRSTRARRCPRATSPPSGKTGTALPSPFKFRKYGQSGIEVSEIFARTAAHVDDICVIRSMHANTPNHEQSMRLMNCGDERLSRPSMGAWLTYGMGTENENLPGFIAMCPGLPVADVSNWRSAFLPGIYQGTYIDTRQGRRPRS